MNNSTITYEDIINDFNQRGEVYEGIHSLINFASKHYPNQFDAFCDMVDRISNDKDVSSDYRKPLDDMICFAEKKVEKQKSMQREMVKTEGFGRE